MGDYIYDCRSVKRYQPLDMDLKTDRIVQDQPG